MSLALHTGLITKDSWEKEVFDFFSGFDSDINGENGAEYTVPEAVENGYSSSLDYFIARAKEKYSDVEDMINFVFLNVESTYEIDDYIGVEFSITQIGDQFVVSFAYCSN